jgi:hypothetical protein
VSEFYKEVLRKRIRQALEHVLAVERKDWARELADILRELADELEPSRPPKR